MSEACPAANAQGSRFSNVSCTIREMENAGASAIHVEDQVQQKRCGHRPNKSLVSTEEMVARIEMALNSRTDSDFFIMARTDAFAKEGMEASIDRAQAYVDAGADGIFVEAVQTKEHYRAFKKALSVPILANMTEFGKTELYNMASLHECGVDMILYPLSAFRAMNQAAENVYRTILIEGDQKTLLETMQTREELYEYLGYHAYEAKLDETMMLRGSRDEDE